MAVDNGFLGSIDANRGDAQNGWDTDQVPGDPYDLTQATQRLRKAQENAVQAKYEFIIRQMVLDIYAK